MQNINIKKSLYLVGVCSCMLKTHRSSKGTEQLIQTETDMPQSAQEHLHSHSDSRSERLFLLAASSLEEAAV